MKFQLEGKSIIILEHKEGEPTSTLVETKINIGVDKNADKSHFLGKDELPTQAGTKALTQCFVQGLIANIHAGHQKGYWDSAEHLRYIIKELERGFVEIGHVSESNF